MDPTLKTALIAAGSALFGGIITGVIAPHVAWGIEKRRARFAKRRALVDDWRAYIFQIRCNYDPSLTVLAALEYSIAFASLKPRLSKSILNKLETTDPTALDLLLEAVGRIEKKWGLV